MSKHLDVVKKYFKYCVDGKDVERVAEFFADDVVVHRPDCPAPIVGVEPFKQALRLNVTERYESIATTFQKEVVAGDVVVVALMHHAKGSNTWHGFDVSGKDLSWSALTYSMPKAKWSRKSSSAMSCSWPSNWGLSSTTDPGDSPAGTQAHSALSLCQ